MCGILGQLNFEKIISTVLFESMLNTMAHRGPDGSGTYFSADQKTALGHRRLALIDLSENGRQPLFNEDKSIWLTVNGEIYNSPELRNILLQKGHQFSSMTDSEVIIHGYEEWGTAILNKLKGMFAFGLWDEKKQQLFLARDRFGIKPLYYYPGIEHFIFASELKGIVSNTEVRKEIDITSFCDYLTYRYIPSPKTIYKNICKLPAAHYLLLKKNSDIFIEQYYELSADDYAVSEKDAAEKTNELILQSIKEHTLSDLPVGTFLSGGYDSSAITYYLNKLSYKTSTYSIGFENWEKSEHHYAEIVSELFHTNHTSKIINESSYELIDKLVCHYDEPIADISIVPTYLVSELASKNHKAVFSGEGADEIFSGYTWHHAPAHKYKPGFFNNRRNSYNIRNYAEAMAMGLFDRKELHATLHPDLHDQIPEDPFWFYRKHFKKELSPVKRFQYLDIKTFMGELVLTKVDRASMANSLEVRVPFLDHELVEYMFHLDEHAYIKKGYKKYLLFENIKNVLPDTILQREKQGFVGPDRYYQNLKWYKEKLMNSQLAANGIVDQAYIDKKIADCDYWRLWKIAVMETWYNLWIKQSPC